MEMAMDLAVELVLDMGHAVEVAKQKPSLCPLDRIRAHCGDNRAGFRLSHAAARAESPSWWSVILYGRHNRDLSILAKDSHC